MRKAAFGVSAVLLLVTLVSARLFFRHIDSRLNAIRGHINGEGAVSFHLLPVTNSASYSGFELVSAHTRYTTGIGFRGKLYLGGPGGLAIYDSPTSRPTLLRTGIDLPPAPIVALATGRLRGDAAPSVFAATQGEGLLLLSTDGSARMNQLLPETAQARDITAVLPLGSGDILLGTRRAGLLLYDGKSLKLFQPNFANLTITALAGDEGDLWIGTRTHGVLHWRAGQLDTIGPSAGLPDPLVEAIAISPAGVFVGTPLGVAQFNGGHFARVLGQGLFVRSLTLDANTLLVATIDQGTHEIPLSLHASMRTSFEDQGWNQDRNVAHFFTSGQSLMAIDGEGLLQRQADGSWQTTLAFPPQPLASRNVTSLSFSPDGRLWIGYFDHGIDVLDLQTDRANHVEDDHVFCINRIVPDAQRDTMDVATGNGLVLLDATQSIPRERQVLSRRDGLIADQVTDIAFTRDGLALATPAGITFLTSSGAQSLYAFQGLVNNHVYTLAAQSSSSHVVAGTLGGISILDDETVRQNITLKNSGLNRNWITALLRVPQLAASQPTAIPVTWMVGTYGGGIVQMDDTGHVTSTNNPATAAVVNPNALFATPQHIFAGTLDNGLFSYNRASRRWTHILSGLPSRSVTAFAESNGELYIGTENGIVRIAESRLP
jgi:ligand-binding sensor domain-containing protein